MNKHLPIALNCSIVAALAVLFSFRAEAQSGGVDTLFKPGFDGDVFSIRIQPDDKLLVSGFFSKVGNVSRSGIARLNSDGTLDTSFDPGSGAFDTIFNRHGLVETLALAIFSDMQIGHDREAMTLVAVTVALAFAAVFTVEILLRKRARSA